MTVYITFSSVGTDAGPFNLYSNVDGYASPFAVNVPKASLLAGYPSASVPDGTTIIRARSTGVCTNFTDLPVLPAPITTTTTLAPVTTTTTTTLATGFYYNITTFTCGTCPEYGGGNMANPVPLIVGKFYYHVELNLVVRIDSFIMSNNLNPPQVVFLSSQQDTCAEVVCPTTTTTTTLPPTTTTTTTPPPTTTTTTTVVPPNIVPFVVTGQHALTRSSSNFTTARNGGGNFGTSTNFSAQCEVNSTPGNTYIFQHGFAGFNCAGVTTASQVGLYANFEAFNANISNTFVLVQLTTQFPYNHVWTGTDFTLTNGGIQLSAPFTIPPGVAAHMIYVPLNATGVAYVNANTNVTFGFVEYYSDFLNTPPVTITDSFPIYVLGNIMELRWQ